MLPTLLLFSPSLRLREFTVCKNRDNSL